MALRVFVFVLLLVVCLLLRWSLASERGGLSRPHEDENPAQSAVKEACRIIHHVPWQYQSGRAVRNSRIIPTQGWTGMTRHMNGKVGIDVKQGDERVAAWEILATSGILPPQGYQVDSPGSA